MQAVELVVFFLATVIIASLILIFIAGINPDEMYDTIQKLVFPQPLDQNTLLTVTKTGFAGKMGACWEHCAFGAKDLKCVTFHITDEGLEEPEKLLSAEELQAIFDKYNFCSDCTDNVEVVPATIALPAVVALECESRKLVVSG